MSSSDCHKNTLSTVCVLHCVVLNNSQEGGLNTPLETSGFPGGSRSWETSLPKQSLTGMCCSCPCPLFNAPAVTPRSRRFRGQTRAAPGGRALRAACTAAAMPSGRVSARNTVLLVPTPTGRAALLPLGPSGIPPRSHQPFSSAVIPGPWRPHRRQPGLQPDAGSLSAWWPTALGTGQARAMLRRPPACALAGKPSVLPRCLSSPPQQSHPAPRAWCQIEL